MFRNPLFSSQIVTQKSDEMKADFGANYPIIFSSVRFVNGTLVEHQRYIFGKAKLLKPLFFDPEKIKQFSDEEDLKALNQPIIITPATDKDHSVSEDETDSNAISQKPRVYCHIFPNTSYREIAKSLTPRSSALIRQKDDYKKEIMAAANFRKAKTTLEKTLFRKKTIPARSENLKAFFTDSKKSWADLNEENTAASDSQNQSAAAPQTLNK